MSLTRDRKKKFEKRWGSGEDYDGLGGNFEGSATKNERDKICGK